MKLLPADGAGLQAARCAVPPMLVRACLFLAVLMIPVVQVRAEEKKDNAKRVVAITAAPQVIAIDLRDEAQTIRLAVAVDGEPSMTEEAIIAEPFANLPDGLLIKASPAGAKFVERDQTGAATGKVFQLFALTTSQVPPRLNASTLYLPIRYGNIRQVLALSLSVGTAPPAGSTLTVRGPGAVNWDGRTAIKLVLTAKGASAPHISLAAGPFVDATSRTALSENLCFAFAPDGRCEAHVDLDANSTKVIFLKPVAKLQSETELGDDATFRRPGEFAGSLSLLASNGLEATTTLTLGVTSTRWRLFGTLALLAGIMLSFLISVLIPHLRERDRVIAPFVELRAKLEAARIRRRGEKGDAIDRRSTAILDAMSKQTLVAKRLITSGWFPAVGPTTDAAILKAYLDAQATLVDAVVKLSDALVAAPADRKAGIDAIAGKPNFPADIDAEIKQVLDPKAAVLRTGGVQDLPSLAQLAWRESFRNGVFWIVFALISLVFGYGLMIDANPSFGGLSDLLGAFGWGLGLSTAGSKLAELSPTAIRQTLRPTP